MSNPAQPRSLAAAPDALVLKFAEAPMSGTTKIIATDHVGQQVDLTPATFDGSTVTVNWPTSALAGSYKVAWRVVFPDGHPVKGTWTFSYGVGITLILKLKRR